MGRFFRVLALVLAVSVLLCGFVWAANEEEYEFPDNEILVLISPAESGGITTFSAAADDPFADLEISSMNLLYAQPAGGEGISTMSVGGEDRIYLLTLEDGDYPTLLETIDRLNELPGVSAIPNFYIYPTALPTDYVPANQWSVAKIDADDAWAYADRMETVKVAVFDTGVQTNHEDLVGVIDFDNSFHASPYSTIDDPDGHGTHVAGIIAADWNTVGVSGIAPNVELVIIKVMAGSTGSFSNVIEGFNHIATYNTNHPSDKILISNHSYGGLGSLNAATIEKYFGSNILCVFSAGNLGQKLGNNPDLDALTAQAPTSTVYPAVMQGDRFLTVVNSTSADIKSDSSFYGLTYTQIAAPGTSIQSTYRGSSSSYSTLSGTSMSAPHVTAVAAMMLGANPDLTPAELKTLLLASADEIDALKPYTENGRRLNALAAVEAVLTEEVVISGPSYLLIPGEGENDRSYDFTAAALDELEETLPSQSIRFSLTTTPTGVSLSDGTITVTEQAVPGTFTLRGQSIVTGQTATLELAYLNIDWSAAETKLAEMLYVGDTYADAIEEALPAETTATFGSGTLTGDFSLENGSTTAALGTAELTLRFTVTDEGVYQGYYEEKTVALPVKYDLTEKTAAMTGNTGVGDTLTVAVSDVAASEYTVGWYRGEQVIDGQTAASYTVTAADRGATLTAKLTGQNDYVGELSAAKMIPKTAPVAPTLTLTAGDSKITAAWSVSDDGGSAVTGYQVTLAETATPGTLNYNELLTTTSHTFTGLTNGTGYTVTVKAVNEIGTGIAATKSATPSGGGSGPVGGGGGGGTPATNTETIENKDGSTTVKTTEKDGTVIEVTTYPNGTVEDKTTAPDGSVKATTTEKDGTVTKTEQTAAGDIKSTKTEPNGTVTEAETTAAGDIRSTKTEPNGTVTKTETTAAGAASKTVTLPSGAVYQTDISAAGEVTRTVTRADGTVAAAVTIPVTTAGGGDFADVGGDHWAASAVETVTARGIFQGTGESQFSPNLPMNRAMLATTLYRLSGSCDSAAENPFADVAAGSYYAAATAWGSANGIISGVSEGRFDPDATMTRETLAVMLYRYAQLMNLDEPDGNGAPFTDGGAVSDWAAEGIDWAVRAGILTGKTGGLLDPQGEVTRAEAAVMLTRLLAQLQTY